MGLAGLFCRVQGAGCRVQGAGWNLIVTGKLLAFKRNVQVVDLPWLLHDAVYNRSERWLPPKCQTRRSDGRRVYSYDFKPAINYCIWRNIWNIIWNICWIWFLPCEYQNISTLSLRQYIPSVKILYYFISLFICFICDGNLLLLREDSSQIWNRWRHLWSGHPDSFEEISPVSACRSISTYSGSIVFSMDRRTSLKSSAIKNMLGSVRSL